MSRVAEEYHLLRNAHLEPESEPSDLLALHQRPSYTIIIIIIVVVVVVTIIIIDITLLPYINRHRCAICSETSIKAKINTPTQ